MKEIAILSRGGQGGVTMGQVIAYAATYDGKYVVSIPKYGAERRGAPVQNSIRIDDKPIKRHAQIEHPTDVIALDFTLVPRFFNGDIFKGKGTLTLNATEVPESYSTYTPEKLGYCNIQDITSEFGLIKSGSAMTAIPTIGAFIKVSEVLSLESLHEAIDTMFGRSKFLESNHKAVDKAYETTNIKGVLIH